MRPAPLVVALAALLLPEASAACTRTVGLDLWLPTPDAVDVPTDVELVLTGIAPSTAAVRLVDEATGESTALALRAEPLGEALFPYPTARPAAPLRPGRWYAVQMTPGLFVETRTRRFRTGDGPARGELPTPDVLRAQAVDNFVRSSCGGSNLACLALARPFTWEVIVRRRCDDVVTARLLYREASRDLTVPYDALFSDAPSCFEVRARDGAGRLGLPARVCPDPAGVALVAHQFACETRCVEGRLRVGDVAVAPPPFDETPPACVGRLAIDASVAAALRAEHHARAADAATSCVDAAAPADAAPTDDADAPDGPVDAHADATGGADAAEPPTREQAGCGCVTQARGRARGAYGAWALAALLLRRRRARGG